MIICNFRNLVYAHVSFHLLSSIADIYAHISCVIFFMFVCSIIIVLLLLTYMHLYVFQLHVSFFDNYSKFYSLITYIPLYDSIANFHADMSYLPVTVESDGDVHEISKHQLPWVAKWLAEYCVAAARSKR